MKILYLLSSAAAALPVTTTAFTGPIFPSSNTEHHHTQLHAVSPSSYTTRRSVLIQTAGVILGTLTARPTPSHAGTANPFFVEEVNFEPSQAATSDKIDINGAIVVEYMQFPGFYPSAAGKIVSVLIERMNY